MVLALLRGFFSGISGFPSNISKFQFGQNRLLLPLPVTTSLNIVNLFNLKSSDSCQNVGKKLSILVGCCILLQLADYCAYFNLILFHIFCFLGLGQGQEVTRWVAIVK